MSFDSSSDAEIDEALTAQLQVDILASSGVAGADSIGALTDSQLATAMGTILTNNPGLTAK